MAPYYLGTNSLRWLTRMDTFLVFLTPISISPRTSPLLNKGKLVQKFVTSMEHTDVILNQLPDVSRSEIEFTETVYISSCYTDESVLETSYGYAVAWQKSGHFFSRQTHFLYDR